jgi:hypothetical protein
MLKNFWYAVELLRCNYICYLSVLRVLNHDLVIFHWRSLNLVDKAIQNLCLIVAQLLSDGRIKGECCFVLIMD